MSAFVVEAEMKGGGGTLRVEWRDGRLAVSPPSMKSSIEPLFDLPGRFPVDGFGLVERSLAKPQNALLTILDGIDNPLFGEPVVTKSNWPEEEDEIVIGDTEEPEIVFEGVFPSDE